MQIINTPLENVDLKAGSLNLAMWSKRAFPENAVHANGHLTR